MEDELIAIGEKYTETTVLDGIDRPIRGLVLHINRIGLQTIFSCCGYPYPDEEEPKSHAYKNAYVIFQRPSTFDEYQSFDALTYYATSLGWTANRYHQHWRLDLQLNKAGAPSRAYYIQDEEDKGSYALHDYEMLSIGIWNLTEKVKHIPTLRDKVTIVDGNRYYHEMGIDWQIEPKPDCVIQYKEKESEAPQA